METYVLDKLKKVFSVWLKWGVETTSLCSYGGARSQSCAWQDVLSKTGSNSCTYQTIRRSLSWVCQKKHSPGLWGRNMGVKSAEEETGMSSCLSVDLFSPPGINRAGRRELKAICTYSVASDHMVCSVPCKGRWQLGRRGAAEVSG